MNYLSVLIALVSFVFLSCRKDEPKKEVEVNCGCEGKVFATFTEVRATYLSDNLFALHIDGQRVYGIRCLEDTLQENHPGDFLVSGGYKERCTAEEGNLRTNLSVIPFFEFTSIEKIE